MPGHLLVVADNYLDGALCEQIYRFVPLQQDCLPCRRAQNGLPLDRSALLSYFHLVNESGTVSVQIHSHNIKDKPILRSFIITPPYNFVACRLRVSEFRLN